MTPVPLPTEWTQPADYDELARRFQAANARLLALHAPGGGTAVDAGCGTGLLAEALLARGAAGVTAFDPSPAMVEAARRRLPGDRSSVHLATLSEFEPTSPSDVVASSAMLTWLYPDIAGGVAGLARLARPGGHVLVATAGRSEGSDAYDTEQERLRALAGLAPARVPFFLRRVGVPGLLAAAGEAGLDVDDAFVVEREARLDARSWIRWLVASGAPWDASAQVAPERLLKAVGDGDVLVRHWTAFAICRRRMTG